MAFQDFYELTLKASPLFHSSGQCNGMNMLEPVTRAAVQAILQEASDLGLPLAVTETYRSQELQNTYFKAGATQLPTVGVHHYGMACDMVRMVAGRPNWKVDYTFLGPLAAKHGLIWGGDWGVPGKASDPTVFHDSDHVQRCTVADQTKLFNGSWWPADSYLPGLKLTYKPAPRAKPVAAPPPVESETDRLNDASLIEAKS